LVVHRASNAILPSAGTEQSWLAVRFDESPTVQRFVCHSESDLGLRIKDLAAGEKHLPDYFGIGVEVAGKKIREFAPDLHLWTFITAAAASPVAGKSECRQTRRPPTSWHPRFNRNSS
jgi:hypothetical protein